jgi:hypothetical protein
VRTTADSILISVREQNVSLDAVLSPFDVVFTDLRRICVGLVFELSAVLSLSGFVVATR